MAASASAKPTIEAIVTRYRREASRNDSSHPELEVRMQDVDYNNFAAIYGTLTGADRPAHIGPGRLTQMVSVIMDDPPRGEGPRGARGMRIRELFFREGVRHGPEHVVRKDPLQLPWRVSNAAGMSYAVALSAERPEAQGFTTNEGAVIRVKARVSFDAALPASDASAPPMAWRIDMTVTRQIMGSEAATALKKVVAQMFATTPPMTALTLLTALGIDDDANPAGRELYRYEVEAEFAAAPAARDAIRPADVTAAAAAVLRLANPEYLREAAMAAEIYRTARYLIPDSPEYLRRFQNGGAGLKRLLPQATAVTRAVYRLLYPPVGKFLTDKADGRRALAVVHDGRCVVVADTLLDGFTPTGAVPAGDTILDGELVTGDDAAPTFYAFDALVVAGEDVTGAGFEVRRGHLAAGVAAARAAGLPAAEKAYVCITGRTPADLAREIRGVLESPRPYHTDGLIFVEPGKSYGTTESYKWKPPEHNTIDMLARRAPPGALGTPPFVDRPGRRLHFLFVGISPDLFAALGLDRCPGYSELFGDEAAKRAAATYFPIQFSPSDVPLAYLYWHPEASAEIDGKVVELRCGGGCPAAGGGSPTVGWELVRVREDRARDLATKRYFGNDAATAELVWTNNIDPFPASQLWDGPALDYFMRPKEGRYSAQTGAISFVKTQRIAALKHAGWVVDIGAGKGQDLGRYLDAEVAHLVAVDQDRAALSELVRRKYSHARRRAGRTATTIHVLAADANDPFGETVAKLGTFGLAPGAADALVCNLAVHYFLADLAAMRNFAGLARGVVKVGGTVVLTVLVGEAVHAAFAEGGVAPGETWDVFEGTPPTRKYSLKRLYSAETLEPAGQRIGVLLPFSEGQYYEEYLVNTTQLTAEFAARGFELRSKAEITTFLPDFEARSRDLASLLTRGDRRWLGLYGELVFQRV
jgi:hypothetical protein